MRTILALCLIAVVSACTGTARDDRADLAVKEEASWADRDLGLSRTSVFDTPSPEPVVRDTTDPMAAKDRPRPYKLSPPVIPHAVAELDPITPDENACMECHDGTAAKIVPESHRIDYRHAPDEAGEELWGARYNCGFCHVPQTNAPPLVKNRFRK